MVVLLRMVAVYLFSRLSDLFHDEEVRFTFYDPFDLWLFVAGNHNEVVALLHDGLIAGRRNLDRLKARRATALAVKGQRSRDVMLLCSRVDAFVHPRRVQTQPNS